MLYSGFKKTGRCNIEFYTRSTKAEEGLLTSETSALARFPLIAESSGADHSHIHTQSVCTYDGGRENRIH